MIGGCGFSVPAYFSISSGNTLTETEQTAAEVVVEEKPLSLAEINRRTVALQNKNNEFTAALHRLTEELRKSLRAAFDAGADVSKFVLSLGGAADDGETALDKPTGTAAKKAAKSSK